MAKAAVEEAEQQARQCVLRQVRSAEPAFIVNISDVRVVMHKPTGVYVIPGRDEDTERRGYSVTGSGTAQNCS